MNDPEGADAYLDTADAAGIDPETGGTPGDDAGRITVYPGTPEFDALLGTDDPAPEAPAELALFPSAVFAAEVYAGLCTMASYDGGSVYDAVTGETLVNTLAAAITVALLADVHAEISLNRGEPIVREAQLVVLVNTEELPPNRVSLLVTRHTVTMRVGSLLAPGHLPLMELWSDHCTGHHVNVHPAPH